MILNKGLWISISLDGIPGSISKTGNDSAFLTIYSLEQATGDVGRRYGPPVYEEYLPKPEDQDDFAVLYRKLETLVKNNGLKGPYGEDHPVVFNRFEYVREGSPQELFELIGATGVTVRVEVLDHMGDDDEVEQAKQDFARWIHSGTTFKPNPKIAEADERERHNEHWRLQLEKAGRVDSLIRRFIFFPALIAVSAGLIWWAFSFHWALGVCVASFLGFALWWIRH